MEEWQTVAGCGGACVLAVACAYKLVRPHFPVTVNCWFCDLDTVVPYGNQNCFDCPHCEQYNGFSKDGGYNKDMPGQQREDLNYVIGCTPDDYLGTASALCIQCERNQQMKVKQLAMFVPMFEDNYDAEVDAYRDHLENIYELCDLCQAIVETELRKQDNILRRKLPRRADRSPACSDESPSPRARKLQCSGIQLKSRSTLLSVLMLPFCVIGHYLSAVVHVSDGLFKKPKSPSEEITAELYDTNIEKESLLRSGVKIRPDLELLSKVTEEPLDDLDLELDAVSLGPMSSNLKRSNSGMLSMYGSHSSLSSQSILPPTLLSKPRPLISPAKFHLRLATPGAALSFRSNRMQGKETSIYDQVSSQSSQSADNIFLRDSLTSDTLSLFNQQHTDTSMPRHTVSHTPSSSTLNPSTSTLVQSFESTSNSTMLASPLKKNSFWEHSNFAQTHLSEESLSKCKFAFEKAKMSLWDNPESSGTRMPIRKSLWQQDVGNRSAHVPYENNVFRISSSECNPDESIYNADDTDMTSLDGSKLRKRQLLTQCEDIALAKDGPSRSSSKSSICPVDSTSSSAIPIPTGRYNLRSFLLGLVLLVSVVVNAMVGLYLYSKD